MWTSGTWLGAVRQTWEVLSVGSLIFLVLATHRHPKICWNSTQMLNNMEKISSLVHVMKINHAIIAEIPYLHKICYRQASDIKDHHMYTTKLNKKSSSTRSTAAEVHLLQAFRKCYKMKSLKIKIDTPLRKPDKQTDNYISSITFCY